MAALVFLTLSIAPTVAGAAPTPTGNRGGSPGSSAGAIGARSGALDSPVENGNSLHVEAGNPRSNDANRGVDPARQGNRPSSVPYQLITNSARAWNTRDGMTQTDTSVRLETARGRVVDLRNSASSFANCTNCRSMAVAVLAVVVPSDGHRIHSIHNVNRATARNCTNCTLVNIVHTIAVETAGEPDLSPSERGQLDSLAGQLSSIDRNLPTDQYVSRAEQLIAQYEGKLVSSV